MKNLYRCLARNDTSRAVRFERTLRGARCSIRMMSTVLHFLRSPGVHLRAWTNTEDPIPNFHCAGSIARCAHAAGWKAPCAAACRVERRPPQGFLLPRRKRPADRFGARSPCKAGRDRRAGRTKRCGRERRMRTVQHGSRPYRSAVTLRGSGQSGLCACPAEITGTDADRGADPMDRAPITAGFRGSKCRTASQSIGPALLQGRSFGRFAG